MFAQPETTGRRLSGWTWALLGLTAALLLAGLVFAPPGILGKADAVAYAVCHRIEARSFHIHDRQLPLCARCTGMYLGALAGILVQLWRGRRSGLPTRWQAIPLAMMALAFAFDGVNSYLHLIPGAPRLYEPNNFLRLLTGTGMGLTMASVLVPAFHQSMWRAWDNRPAFSGSRPFAAYLLSGVVIVALVWTQAPALLWPAALLSSAGVLAILTLAYAVIWLMLVRRENRYERWSQLAVPLAAGLATALAQIIVTDIARYWLTGTWGGFPIG